MKREVIRVEPLSTWLERWKAPTSAVTRHGDTIYVSGFPPFDPDTGEIVDAPIERQTELVLEQLKLCVETAGSSLENVLKCNVYCTSVEKFAAVNAIYARYFPKDPPARIFINVPAWPGHFDIEIDCIAAVLYCSDALVTTGVSQPMFSVIFEVHPKPEQWDAYLGLGKMLEARTGEDRRLCRQHPLPQPEARRMDAVAVGLARREGAGALAHPGAASRGAGERPLRNLSRLSFADRPVDAGHQAARRPCLERTAAGRDRNRRGHHHHPDRCQTPARMGRTIQPGRCRQVARPRSRCAAASLHGMCSTPF